MGTLAFAYLFFLGGIEVEERIDGLFDLPLLNKGVCAYFESGVVVPVFFGEIDGSYSKSAELVDDGVAIITHKSMCMTQFFEFERVVAAANIGKRQVIKECWKEFGIGRAAVFPPLIFCQEFHRFSAIGVIKSDNILLLFDKIRLA